jgi:hypothetical protein
MKRTRVHGLLLLASLLVASTGYGASISWTPPTTYKDGSPIPPSDVKRIVMEVYSGPTKDGPWKPVASSYPGQTTVTVPDPPPASTLWYTMKSTLDGSESGFAAPVRMTNYSITDLPIAKKIARMAVHHKKLSFLLLMGLFFGLVLLLRYRGKRRKG